MLREYTFLNLCWAFSIMSFRPSEASGEISTVTNNSKSAGRGAKLHPAPHQIIISVSFQFPLPFCAPSFASLRAIAILRFCSSSMRRLNGSAFFISSYASRLYSSARSVYSAHAPRSTAIWPSLSENSRRSSAISSSALLPIFFIPRLSS